MNHNSDKIIDKIVKAVVNGSTASPDEKQQLFEANTSKQLVDFAVSFADGILASVKSDYPDEVKQFSAQRWDYIEVGFHQAVYLSMLIYTSAKSLNGQSMRQPEDTIEYQNNFLSQISYLFSDNMDFEKILPQYVLEAIKRTSQILFNRLSSEAHLEKFGESFNKTLLLQLNYIMKCVLSAYYAQDNFRKASV